MEEIYEQIQGRQGSRRDRKQDRQGKERGICKEAMKKLQSVNEKEIKKGKERERNMRN